MPHTRNRILVPALILIVASAIFWYVSRTMSSVLVFIPALIIAFVISIRIVLKRVLDPKRVLPLYLFLLGIQFLHFTEEYLTGFTVKLPELFGQSPYPMDYWVTFNMVAYSIFILGGIVLFKQIKDLMIIPVFFILAGVLMNAIGHTVLSIYVRGYFPGLYTALIYLLIVPVFFRSTYKGHTRSTAGNV